MNNFNFQSTLNLSLDKFLPEEWGLHIPLYVDHSRDIGSPEYNPIIPMYFCMMTFLPIRLKPGVTVSV